MRPTVPAARRTVKAIVPKAQEAAVSGLLKGTGKDTRFQATHTGVRKRTPVRRRPLPQTTTRPGRVR